METAPTPSWGLRGPPGMFSARPVRPLPPAPAALSFPRASYLVARGSELRDREPRGRSEAPPPPLAPPSRAPPWRGGAGREEGWSGGVLAPGPAALGPHRTVPSPAAAPPGRPREPGLPPLTPPAPAGGGQTPAPLTAQLCKHLPSGLQAPGTVPGAEAPKATLAWRSAEPGAGGATVREGNNAARFIGAPAAGRGPAAREGGLSCAWEWGGAAW